MPQQEDRIVGVLRGLAVGDALGAQVEFQAKGTFKPISELGYSPGHNIPAGAWTDDTSMALCMGESMVKQGGYDSRDVMATYVRWMDDGYLSSVGTCFDIGGQTRVALVEFKADPAALTAPDQWAAGNGTVMRLAPAAIVSLNLDDDQARDLFAVSTLDTHNNPIAVESTIFFGFLLRNLLRGEGREEALKNALTMTPDADELAARLIGGQPPTAPPSGYVLDTLQVAWWAFITTDSFEEAVLKATNEGADSDTNAAVAGQLAGAYYGDSGIPERWRDGIHASDSIAHMALDLAAVRRGVVARRG